MRCFGSSVAFDLIFPIANQDVVLWKRGDGGLHPAVCLGEVALEATRLNPACGSLEEARAMTVCK